MDSMIYASVRQVSSTWYAIAVAQKRSHDGALSLAMMQAEIYLSDLGLVEAAAQPYLDGARTAIDGVLQGRLQN